jgi:hypothetical protein
MNEAFRRNKASSMVTPHCLSRSTRHRDNAAMPLAELAIPLLWGKELLVSIVKCRFFRKGR